jgi:exonuclease SbcD
MFLGKTGGGVGMKVLHVADTHLGFSAYRKVDEETGLNQRETDLYRAFQSCVDSALELRPDLFLHAGDLFDSVRASNRAISFTMEQFVRLSEAGIPTVVIAGNHSTPKLRETGSVFKIFEHLEGVHPVYAGRYERVKVGDVVVHCVPHADALTMQQELTKVKADQEARFNITVLHAGVGSVGAFASSEFNESVIPDGILPLDMDYIALGHYHQMTRLAEMTYYCGSTERLSFAEASQEKGFLVADLEASKVRFQALPVRRMIDLRPIEAKGMTTSELMKDVEEALTGRDIKDAVVRLNVLNVKPSIYRSMDFRRIHQWGAEALYLEPRFQLQGDEFSLQSSSASITALDQEFVAFLDRYPVTGADKDRVRTLGLQYLSRGIEKCD